MMSSYSSLSSLEDEKQDKSIKYIYKVILVGNSSVGKSSIASVYTHSIFDENEGHTIGVSYGTKKVDVNIDNKKEPAKICLWDTAGQERFFSIIKLYFKGISAVCCVYDESSLTSLRDCERWLNETMQHLELKSDGSVPPIVLVGNKTDKCAHYNNFEKKEREDLIQGYITKYNVKHFQCSAKQNENIDDIFDYLIHNMEYIKIRNEVENQIQMREDVCLHCCLS